MIKGVRVLTLPCLEFEYCNVYGGTFGKSLPLIHRHPDAIVILWNKGDHDHVFFLTMSQLLPGLKDMQANSWSMIVFWSEQKIQLHVRGRMLDLTSRISQRLLLTCRRNRRRGKMKGTIQVTKTGGNPPPGGGPQGPGPGYGPSPGEPPLPMEYHDEAPPPGGPPGAPGTVPQFANPDQVLSPAMAWPASSPIVPVPIPPHPHFPIPKVCIRLRRGMCHKRVLVALIRTISPKRSREHWDLRRCCCLVSRQGRRIVILQVTSRLILSLLLRRLAQLRFLVCQ